MINKDSENMVKIRDALIALIIAVILSGFSWKIDNLIFNWGQLAGVIIGIAILIWSEKKEY